MHSSNSDSSGLYATGFSAWSLSSSEVGKEDVTAGLGKLVWRFWGAVYSSVV